MKKRRKSKILSFYQIFFAMLLFFIFSGESFGREEKLAPGRAMAKQAVKTKKLWITSDHTKHEILKKNFQSGPEVTKACLSCHTEAALQFHKTIHWTWMDPNTAKSEQLGKGGLSINNF